MCCRVKTCCCGMSLKNGSATIAILGIIGTVFSIVSDAVWHPIVISEYRIGFHCVAAVALLFSILLLVAIFNKTITPITKRRLMLPWLISNMIYMIALIVVSVALIVLGSIILALPSATEKNIHSGSVGVVVGVVYFIAASISVYFWIVVRSYYQELKEQNYVELLIQQKKKSVV